MKKPNYKSWKAQMNALNRALNVLDIIIEIGSGTSYDIAVMFKHVSGSKLALEYLITRNMMDVVGYKDFQKIHGKHVYDSSIYGLGKYTAYEYSSILYDELNALEMMHDALARKLTAKRKGERNGIIIH